jgi:GTP-binding protein HflX
MNRLLTWCGGEEEKQVLEKDMLFATLDTAVRRIDPQDKRAFLLTDTVGFIHKLPHGLVKAFRSTLEEIRYADLLVQVIDFADENHKKFMKVTKDTLKELEIGDIPMIYVYNKCDKLLPPMSFQEQDNQIYISCSAKEGDVLGNSMERLLSKIQDEVYKDQETAHFMIPYGEGREASYLREHTAVLSHSYEETGERFMVRGTKMDLACVKQYRESFDQ